MLKLFLLIFILLNLIITLYSQKIPSYIHEKKDLEIFLSFYDRDSIEKLEGREGRNPYIEYLSLKNNELDDSTFLIANFSNNFYLNCSRFAFQSPDLESELFYGNNNIFNGTGRIHALLSYFLKVPRSRFINIDYPFYFDLKVDLSFLTTIDKKIELSNIFLKNLNLKLIKESIDTCFKSLDIVNLNKLNSLKLNEQEFEKQLKLVEWDTKAKSKLYDQRNNYRSVVNYWRRLEFASKGLINMSKFMDGEYDLNIDPYLLENCSLNEINTELLKNGLKLSEKIGKIDFYRFVKLTTD